MSGGRRIAFLAAAAAVVWYACVLIFWATQPLSDSVPVGVDYNPKQPVFVSVSVSCNNVLDGAARDGSALPVLKPQPKGSPSLAYQRDPCAIVHSQARLVFALDTAVMLVVLGFAGWVVFWRPRAARAPLLDDRRVELRAG
jgi:hypothetical protein